jgi:hypothetical protein
MLMEDKETMNMGKNRIIGTWVGIFAFVAIMLGGLEHTRPGPIQAASIRPASLSGGLLFPPLIEPAP